MRWHLASLLIVAIATGSVGADDLTEPLKALRAVGPKGKGHQAAITAWNEVAKADPEDLPTVLSAMDGASILPSNWIRSAAETIADRATKNGKALPKDALEAFVLDTKHSPRPRRLAFELLAQVDKTARNRIIPSLSQDPSLELRRDAISMAVEKAEALAKAGDKAAATAAYQQVFVNTRDVDQVRDLAKTLKDLGAEPDLPSHFGFVMQWNLIGPFDNRDKGGFDVAYPPENEVKLNAQYNGVDGKVAWKQHATNDPFGIVDLNTAMGKHKGAVAYAYAEFDASEASACEIRIGCINGNKVWLNGKELISNHVYHAGMDVDQYVGAGTLKKGKNHILVKICQNEQTEGWAQRWQFQLRVCDHLGTAILATDRKLPKAASLDASPLNVVER